MLGVDDSVDIVDKKNFLSDLCEMDLRLKISEDLDYTCVVRLAVQPHEISFENTDYQVFLTALMLKMDLTGFFFVQESRYGDPVVENVMAIKKRSLKTDELEMSKSAGLGASASISKKSTVKAEVQVSTEGKRKSKERTIAEAEADEHHYKVRAMTNGRWKVSEPHDGVLDGTYLNHDKLCSLKGDRKSNYHSVGVTLYFRQRDAHFWPLESNKKAVKNLRHKHSDLKQKLIGVLAAKTLHQNTGTETPYNGTITASVHGWTSDAR